MPTLSERVKQTIVDKISNNRLTILVGPTGCGKSTSVPPLVLAALGGPILCTQPRRLAAVAIATRVASDMGVELGNEVGYQIGNRKTSSRADTRLLFATAGVLLERLRADGLNEFSRYSLRGQRATKHLIHQ